MKELLRTVFCILLFLFSFALGSMAIFSMPVAVADGLFKILITLMWLGVVSAAVVVIYINIEIKKK